MACQKTNSHDAVFDADAFNLLIIYFIKLFIYFMSLVQYLKTHQHLDFFSLVFHFTFRSIIIRVNFYEGVSAQYHLLKILNLSIILPLPLFSKIS